MKKFTSFLSEIFLVSFAWIFLMIGGVFISIIAWFRVGFSVWFRRFWQFGVFLASFLLVAFGIHMMHQAFNATALSAIVVVCITGMLVIILGIIFFVKFMPRKEKKTPSYVLR